MKNIKKYTLLLCLILVCSAIGGCYNYIDVDDQFVVMGVAIDKDKQTGEYIMITEVTKSTGGADSKLISEVGYTKSKSLFEATRNNIMQIGTKLYYGHVLVYIIGENMASEGISDLINILARQSQIRSDLYILVADDKTLYKIFEFDDPIHEDVSQHISGLLEAYESSGKFRQAPLFRVIQDLASPEVSLLLPIIHMENVKEQVVDKDDQPPEEEKKEEEEKSGDGGAEEQSDDEGGSSKDGKSQDEIPHVKGCAVFKKDKMVGTLDEYETRSALILKKELTRHYSISIEENGAVPTCAIEIINSSIKIDPKVTKDKKLKFDIELELEGDLVELDGPVDYIADEPIGVLEIAFEKLMKNQLRDVIHVAQHEYGSDIFGFAGITHIKQPAFWKNMPSVWDDIFKEAHCDVTVTVDITSSSLSMNPIKVGR